MSATELKPCPFCGGEARYQIDHTTEERNSVWCGKCDFGMFDPDDTGSVVAAWNTRADLAPAAPKVKALVWVELARGLFGATTPFGCYHVWEGHYQAPCDRMGQPALDPRSEAQADYEARILAALEGGDG